MQTTCGRSPWATQPIYRATPVPNVDSDTRDEADAAEVDEESGAGACLRKTEELQMP